MVEVMAVVNCEVLELVGWAPNEVVLGQLLDNFALAVGMNTAIRM